MIPEKVKIAGIEYEVQEVENMELHFEQLGQILYTKGIIKIDDGMSQERKEQTFIHELLHGMFYEAGYEEQDEDMINRLGIVLYQVLKDNSLFCGCKDQILKRNEERLEEIRKIPISVHPNT